MHLRHLLGLLALALLPALLAQTPPPAVASAPTAFATPATPTTPATPAPSPAPVAPADSAAFRRNVPAYPTPYEPATAEQIKTVLDRVLAYIETAAPVKIVDRATQQPVTDLAHLPPRAGLGRTDFLPTSYEWGVTYSGLLAAGAATSDPHYRAYVDDHFTALTTLAAHLAQQPPPASDAPPREAFGGLRNMLHPIQLDDCGAMAAAMIKAARAGLHPDALRPQIDRYVSWIRDRQFRLPDGTLARNRPMPDTLWLDDLYMSVPALAQMGALTGDAKYFDDAAKQITQFSARMFVPEKNLYRHGWVQAMDPHPAFFWARANGWAVVAMTELLEVLPETHPARASILAQYKSHVAGLAPLQDSTGLWHQLLDRPDSYLETSASAMYVYAIAHGINRGWLDAKAYGPMVSLAWNAVAQKVNAQGQVEGTCIGTGMGFDPMFYYYRPTSVYAAHGYGPVFLAGAEMIALHSGKGAAAVLHDGGLHYERATGR